MRIFISSLRQTIKSSFFVLNSVNKYFGFYFIACSLVILFFVGLSLSGQETEYVSTITYLAEAGLIFFAHVFTIFMIPYYAYKYNYVYGADKAYKRDYNHEDENNRTEIRPFWTFVSENVWPVVMSQIKAFFVILLFLLLLVFPGIYKSIRYTFITHTVFFDNLYKQDRLSVLKSADRTSRGYFWLIVFFIFCRYFVTFVVDKTVDISFFSFPLSVTNSLSFIFNLYLSWLFLLFQTQLYFEIKRHRGETVSC